MPWREGTAAIFFIFKNLTAKRENYTKIYSRDLLLLIVILILAS
jgi:hypothetical protein